MSAIPIQKIGRYEIISEIGRGGMAVVYKAYDARFKRDVAIKILPAELLHDSAFRARFEREACVIAALEHNAIVPVYDFGEEDGQPFFVMRLMAGGSLTQRIKESSAHQKPFNLAEIIPIFEAIAPGLDFAHSQGMVHRDLKPDNILFDAHNTPYIADFGIVKLSESGATLTGNAIVGTPAYMSPEQGRGEADIDGRSDLYSLGAILFECLTGRHVFEADSQMAMVLKQISAPVPNLLDFRPDLTPAVQQVLIKAMHKKKTNRFSTAAEFVEALKAAADGSSTLADVSLETINLHGNTPERISSTPHPIPVPLPTPHPAPPPPPSPRRKSRLFPVAVSAFILLVLLIGGLMGAQALGVLQGWPNFLSQVPVLNTWLPGLAAQQPSATPAIATVATATRTQTQTLIPPTPTSSTPRPTTSDIISTSTPAVIPTLAAEVQATPNSLPLLETATYITDDRTVVTINNFDHIQKLQVNHIGFLNEFDVSPDGSTIAVATTTGILFRDAAGVAQDYFLPTQWNTESLVYSPDGKWIASANQHETLLIDALSKQIVGTLANPITDRTRYVAFSANSEKLLSGGVHTYIWEVPTGQLVQKFENADAGISGISADGQLAGVPLEGNDIKIVNLADGTELRTLRVFNATRIIFSPDGTLLSVVNTGQITRFFKVPDWEDLGNKDGNHIVYAKDGKTMAIDVAKNHEIVIWGLNVSGLPTQKLQTYNYDRDGSVGMSLSDDGYYFAYWYTGQVTLDPVAEKYAVAVYRVVDNKQVSVLNTAATWTSSAHFAPDGESLFTLSSHSYIQHWDAINGLEIGKYSNWITPAALSNLSEARPAAHGGMAISSNGVMKAVVNGNNIDLFFVQDGNLIRTIKATYDQEGDLAISPDGQTLANTSTGGLIRVWRVDDGRQICTIGGAMKDLAALHFSSDGKTIGVYRSSNTLSFYDASNCKQQAKYTVGSGYFSYNRDLFIDFLNGEGQTRDIIIRRVDNGEPLMTFYGPFTEFSFSANGDLLQAVLFDGTYHAWGIPAAP